MNAPPHPPSAHNRPQPLSRGWHASLHPSVGLFPSHTHVHHTIRPGVHDTVTRQVSTCTASPQHCLKPTLHPTRHHTYIHEPAVLAFWHLQQVASQPLSSNLLSSRDRFSGVPTLYLTLGPNTLNPNTLNLNPTQRTDAGLLQALDDGVHALGMP